MPSDNFAALTVVVVHPFVSTSFSFCCLQLFPSSNEQPWLGKSVVNVFCRFAAVRVFGLPGDLPRFFVDPWMKRAPFKGILLTQLLALDFEPLLFLRLNAYQSSDNLIVREMRTANLHREHLRCRIYDRGKVPAARFSICSFIFCISHLPLLLFGPLVKPLQKIRAVCFGITSPSGHQLL